MKRYIVSCRVITPLFMGGADQQAELRTQSINGMLRWWFRVAGGSKKDEEILFGWGGEKANQGLVRIFIKDFDRLRKEKFSKEFDDKGMVRQDKGINYIGFSLDQRFKIDQQGKIQREYIKENQTFDLKISFHPRSTEDDIKKFFATLWLAFNLGNFGSRSRRGFGSIKIEKIEEDGRDITNNCFGLNFNLNGDISKWINDNLNKIKDVINPPNNNDNIPFIFGSNFKIYRLNKGNYLKYTDWVKGVQKGRNGKYLKSEWGGNGLKTWKDILDFMGFLLMAYRSYKEPDYNIAKSILRGESRDTLTFERAIFGLPLNFFYSSLKKGGMVRLVRTRETLRRASPIMIKVIQNDGNYEGLFIVTKSKFKPDDSELEFNGKSVKLPEDNMWIAIDYFIFSLKSNELIFELR
jgi:CRISPR-associated protein Cmr1